MDIRIDTDPHSSDVDPRAFWFTKIDIDEYYSFFLRTISFGSSDVMSAPSDLTMASAMVASL